MPLFLLLMGQICTYTFKESTGATPVHLSKNQVKDDTLYFEVTFYAVVVGCSIMYYFCAQETLSLMEITYGSTYINSIRFPTDLQPGQPLNSYISGLDLEGLGPYRVLDRGGQVSFDTCDDSWSRRKNHPGKDLGNQP